MPPLAYPVVGETALDSYTYARTGDGGGLEMRMDAESGGESGGSEGAGKVPFATWDPDVSSGMEGEEVEGREYEDLVKQMIVRVTLDPGDMLYLPTQWYSFPSFPNQPTTKTPTRSKELMMGYPNRYHKVSQRCSEEGICCAVNYWYVILCDSLCLCLGEVGRMLRRRLRLISLQIGMIWNLEGASIPL